MRVLGLLIAAVPLGFGLMRAVTTGSDFRYVWVAFASTGAAALVARRQWSSTIQRALGAVVAAAIAAAAAGFAVGARNAVSLLVVAAGFAVCSGPGMSWAARPSAGAGMSRRQG